MRRRHGVWSTWAGLVVLAIVGAAADGDRATAGSSGQSPAGVAPAAPPGPSGPREGHPAIFLAWNAPFGLPGARQAVQEACDDSTVADTLYLTFDPGEDVEGLIGIEGTLSFRAAPGDTLGPFWDFTRRGANPWNLRIEFDEPPEGVESAWPMPGSGFVRYSREGAVGKLYLSYAIPSSQAGPAFAGKRYFFARVMLRLRRPGLAGCRQPVCVELNHLSISRKGGDRWVTSGSRFTSWNSPDDAACRERKAQPPDPEPPRFGGMLEPPGAAPDTTRR